MKITIIKRNGKQVNFNPNKITVAVQKATKQSGESINADFTDKVVEKLEKMGEQLAVEVVQDVVEETLMECGFKKTAREYIKYRNWRTEQRELQGNLDKAITDIVSLSNGGEQLNAQCNDKLFTAKKEAIAAKVMKDYALKYLISPDVAKGHKDNLIYIHDLSSYTMACHNCTLVDLKDILGRGFMTNNGGVRPPTTVRSAMQQIAVILQCVSNEQFGGVAGSAMDYALAPYVEMSFQKWIKKAQELSEEVLPETTLEAYSENENKFLDWAYKQLENEVAQSCEALIHNLNTLTSRSGGSLPFTSVNYGTDTSKAGRLVSKHFLIARQNGIGEDNLTPIFPIGVFKYKKGVNDKPGTPNYDLKKLAIETTSKRIYPNFVNVSVPHLPQDGDYNNEAETMGCRTAVGTDRHGLKCRNGRGNANPVTVNLLKIALLHEKPFNKERFFNELDEVIDLAIKALVERFEYQGKQLAASAPFLYENQILKGKKLAPDEPVREVLKHETLALGYHALSNALVALIGKHHGESEEALELGLEIVKHFYDRAAQASEQYDLNFSAYATP